MTSSPCTCTPYSPDFKPIERRWQHFKSHKSHYLVGFLTKSEQALADKLEEAIRCLLDTPNTLKSACDTHSR